MVQRLAHAPHNRTQNTSNIPDNRLTGRFSHCATTPTFLVVLTYKDLITHNSLFKMIVIETTPHEGWSNITRSYTTDVYRIKTSINLYNTLKINLKYDD